AAELHDTLQLDLTPAAADLRGTQRGDELVGAVVEAAGGAHHRLDLAGQGGVGGGPVLLEFAELAADRAHGLLESDDAGIGGGGRELGRGGCRGTSISMGEPAEDDAERNADEEDRQGGTHAPTVSHTPDTERQ